MRQLTKWFLGLIALLMTIGFLACEDQDTYAEQLAKEKADIKAFMNERGYRVTTTYPDSIPFPEGVFFQTKAGLYVHVLDTGIRPSKVIPDNTVILVRFLELNMQGDTVYQNMFGTGDPFELYYNNVQTTATYGDCQAWHDPLEFVADGGHVYVITPTKLGMPMYTSTTQTLTPCFYELRYTFWK
ncbi:MAG TPA: hypothetical protein DD409_12275 [Bacteroidales bacterium]|nr:hypothetical protein [Bacteroidales bacterium]